MELGIFGFVLMEKIGDAAGFGAGLQQLRKSRGLSQEDLGKKVGLSIRMMTYYEQGHGRLPTGEIILKLAKALHVSVDHLLGIKQIKAESYPRDVRLLKRLRRIEKLPRHDQRTVLAVLDGLLAKRNGAGDNNGRGRKEAVA